VDGGKWDRNKSFVEPEMIKRGQHSEEVDDVEGA
jgi:hypothetical protein